MRIIAIDPGRRTGKGAHGVDPWCVDTIQQCCAKRGIPLFVKGNAGVEGAPQEYPEGLILPQERNGG